MAFSNPEQEAEIELELEKRSNESDQEFDELTQMFYSANDESLIKLKNQVNFDLGER